MKTHLRENTSPSGRATASSPGRAPGVRVHGARWCADTRRSLRHLRRLGVRHRYLDVDDEPAAFARIVEPAVGGRTPVVEVAGERLVEPTNETLTTAVIGAGLRDRSNVAERLSVQNVGDLERVVRAAGAVLGLLMLVRRRRISLGHLLGLAVAATGVSGWCPVYHAARVSSLGGPGDRPAEAERGAWLARPGPSESTGRTLE